MVIYSKSLNWLIVTSGVPQGSLLGPVLFVLFINDMSSVLSHSSTLALFADDAECFRTIRSHSDCSLPQDDIEKLIDCSENRKLALKRKRNPIIYNYKM